MIWLFIAVTVWILAGIPNLAGGGSAAEFISEPGERRLARRPMLWSVRGGVIGATFAFVARTVLVPPTPTASPEAYELASSFGPWPWLASAAIGVVIGATLAVGAGSRPAPQFPAAELRGYLPLPLAVAAAASAVISVAAVVAITVMDQGVPVVAATTSAIGAVIAAGVFALGWRPIVARSPRGLGDIAVDITRATAIWALAALPLLAMLATIDQLVQSRVPDDLPADLGEFAGVVHLATFSKLVSMPVAILLINYVILLSPLWVIRKRHPLQWAANRQAHRAARNKFRKSSVRAESHSSEESLEKI